MSGFMINVVLPSKNMTAVASMAGVLSSKHGFYFTYASVNSTTTGEVIIYTRLSAQVYLELSDFVKLAALVSSLLSVAV